MITATHNSMVEVRGLGQYGRVAKQAVPLASTFVGYRAWFPDFK